MITLISILCILNIFQLASLDSLKDTVEEWINGEDENEDEEIYNNDNKINQTLKEYVGETIEDAFPIIQGKDILLMDKHKNKDNLLKYYSDWQSDDILDIYKDAKIRNIYMADCWKNQVRIFI